MTNHNLSLGPSITLGSGSTKQHAGKSPMEALMSDDICRAQSLLSSVQTLLANPTEENLKEAYCLTHEAKHLLGHAWSDSIRYNTPIPTDTTDL